MQLPIIFQVNGQTEAYSKRHYILKLNKNLYGLKQWSYNWNEKLKKSLVDQGFKPSDIDPCLHIGNGMVVSTYVNDCIIMWPSVIDVYGFIDSTKNGCGNLVLTNQGDINKFLSIEIAQLDEKRLNISQTFLIEKSLLFSISTKTTMVWTPTLSKPRLSILSYTNICLEILAKNNGTTKQQSVC